MILSSIKNLFNWFQLATKTLDNVFMTFLLRIGIKNEVLVKTKNIGNFNVKNNTLKAELINLIMNFQYYVFNNKIDDYTIESFSELMNLACGDGDIIKHEGINYWKTNLISVLFEPFFEEGNIPLEHLESEVVIDVGANIGDTALYFANKGCEVFAFEPVPDIYDMAIKNIELNPNLSDKIHIFNKAVSDKNGEIEIYYAGLSSSTYVKGRKKYNIESLSLNQIISNMLAKNITPTLLKMDCEGSEFDIVPNSDLCIFKELIIEYHSTYTGLNKNIITDSLKKKGFEIKKIYKAPGNIDLDDMGIIHAINRKNNKKIEK